jgi:hypothetical protein
MLDAVRLELTRLNADASRNAPFAEAAASLQAGARHKGVAGQAGGNTVSARCCHRAAVVGSIAGRRGAWTSATCGQHIESVIIYWSCWQPCVHSIKAGGKQLGMKSQQYHVIAQQQLAELQLGHAAVPAKETHTKRLRDQASNRL